MAQQTPRQILENTENTSGNFKFGIILIVILLVVLFIIFGVYVWRTKSGNGNIGTTSNGEPKASFIERLLGTKESVVAKADADVDGLADETEVKLKTDPTKVDTDGEGLTDREETMVYKTDPNKTDTDGDGMSDADEIKNRRDPLNNNPEAEWPPRPTNLAS